MTLFFFVLQGDDMPDIPPESVTEEEYVDEQGHRVVKKVELIYKFLSTSIAASFLHPILGTASAQECK